VVARLLPLEPQGDIVILLVEPFEYGASLVLMLFQRVQIVFEVLVLLIALYRLNILLQFMFFLCLIHDAHPALLLSPPELSLLLQLLLRLLIL
jgi:hypothetical protein